MALLGQGAVAMWWNMAAAHRTEFENWHSHEHLPERLGIPGFLRGSRWASATGGDGYFVLYELASYDTLTSPGYLARLNAPTPWSQQMMPRHADMVRSQCRVLESHGGGLGGAMLTIRLSPRPGAADALRDRLHALLQALPGRAGVTAAHLLLTQTPPAAATTEQKIRGGADRAADWIVLVSGYDAQVLQGLGADELGSAALGTAGAAEEVVAALHRLSHAVTPDDI